MFILRPEAVLAELSFCSLLYLISLIMHFKIRKRGLLHDWLKLNTVLLVFPECIDIYGIVFPSISWKFDWILKYVVLRIFNVFPFYQTLTNVIIVLKGYVQHIWGRWPLQSYATNYCSSEQTNPFLNHVNEQRTWVPAVGSFWHVFKLNQCERPNFLLRHSQQRRDFILFLASATTSSVYYFTQWNIILTLNFCRKIKELNVCAGCY